MAVYIGEMLGGLQVENGNLVGQRNGFVRVLCNDNIRADGFNLGPVSYSIDPSFFQIEKSIPSYKVLDETILPVSYNFLVRQLLKDAREKEDLVILLGAGSLPKKGIVLCEEYPNRELVASAKVSEKFISEQLARFGKKFS